MKLKNSFALTFSGCRILKYGDYLIKILISEPSRKYYTITLL